MLETLGGPCVRLIERREVVGRGAAYAAGGGAHALNVRASNMSAYPDRPRHLLDWLDAANGGALTVAFVSRERYGDYLHLLLRAVSSQGEAGRLAPGAELARLQKSDVRGSSSNGALG